MHGVRYTIWLNTLLNENDMETCCTCGLVVILGFPARGLGNSDTRAVPIRWIEILVYSFCNVGNPTTGVVGQLSVEPQLQKHMLAL